jgi:LAO/AO transport system kinase
MATRGALGGLAYATADIAMVLDAAGRQVVMIETVGVGQDEVDIARLADITLVVLVPGMGDDVQSIKAGIMEIADIFVINKSDRDGAEQMEREIRALQSLVKPRANADHPSEGAAWTPPVIKTVANEGRGIAELAQAIADYRQYLDGCELGRRRRVENWRNRLLEMLRAELMRRLRSDYLSEPEAARLAAEIAERRRDPYSLVQEILGRLAGS